MQTIPGHVLVSIAEADRRKLFEKEIERDDGGHVILTIALPAEKNSEDSYGQSVSVGTVVWSGDDTPDIKIGDIVVLDYIVDVTDDMKVLAMSEHKIVRVDTRTSYFKKSRLMDANRKTKHPTLLQKAGDLEKSSPMIAVYRDRELHPLVPYVITEHVPEELGYTHKASQLILLRKNEGDVVLRRVLAVPPGSKLRKGQQIFCESASLFERNLNELSFDVVMEHDVLAKIN